MSKDIATGSKQTTPYYKMMLIGESLRKLITAARAPLQPVELPGDVVSLLVEAQQAVYAAMRKLEEKK